MSKRRRARKGPERSGRPRPKMAWVAADTAGRCRYLPASAFPRLPPGWCRFCRNRVPPGRKSKSWCSQDCIDLYQAARSGSGLRRYIFKRDRGVCFVCRLDAVGLAAEVGRWMRSNSLRQFGTLARNLLRVNGKADGETYRNTFWDADHRVRVADGGGVRAGLRNVQTLCMWCHKIKTAAEVARLNGLSPPSLPTGAEFVAVVMPPVRSLVRVHERGGVWRIG
jgi:5-methylcytosine-specific restriction protein A